jgi:hypothetical protein
MSRCPIAFQVSPAFAQITLVLILAISPLDLPAQAARKAGPKGNAAEGFSRDVASQYLMALQKSDYVTLAKMTDIHRAFEEERIQDKNPRSLWPGLMASRIQERIEGLQWGATECLAPSNLPCETAHNEYPWVRAQLAQVPPGCKWAVTEVRPIGARNGATVKVFVEIEYPPTVFSSSDSGWPLRRSIAVLAIRDQFVLSMTRVSAGDVRR